MTGKRNYRYLLTLLIVRAYFLGGLYYSFADIQHAFGLLGLTGDRQAVSPLLLDGFAVLGMIARSKYFAESTRRIGLRTQIVASLLSLSANIYAGHNAGERVFGALIVGGYVFSEWFGDHMKPAEADAVQPATAVEVSAAPVVDEAEAKRVIRRERDRFTRAVRREVQRLERDRIAAEVSDLEAVLALPVAPVSPAPGEPGAYL